METTVMLLAEYTNGKIYSGVKTGFNEAFVIRSKNSSHSQKYIPGGKYPNSLNSGIIFTP